MEADGTRTSVKALQINPLAPPNPLSRRSRLPFLLRKTLLPGDRGEEKKHRKVCVVRQGFFSLSLSLSLSCDDFCILTPAALLFSIRLRAPVCSSLCATTAALAIKGSILHGLIFASAQSVWPTLHKRKNRTEHVFHNPGLSAPAVEELPGCCPDAAWFTGDIHLIVNHSGAVCTKSLFFFYI